MRAAFLTLGCKVNQYETEALQIQFEAEGIKVVPPEEDADIYVVNSCTVTGTGDQKTRQLIRRLHRAHPKALLALMGCLPQAFPTQAEDLSEVQVIQGTTHRTRLLSNIRLALETGERVVDITPHRPGEPFEPLTVSRFHERTRSFLKIEDGCDRYCSYCIIPKARGPIRSKSPEDLREDLNRLAQNGYLEVVLVGVNLSSYGKETGYAFDLADAVEQAGKTPGIQRVRLGSLEPELMTDTQLDRMAAVSALCPQFHLALQSGCDETLRRMKRHYTTAEYRALADRIRARFPDAALTTDVMVGFPGETEEEFKESLEFVRSMEFAKVHVFAYSVRPGTKAADFPGQLSRAEKERRSKEMQQAAMEGQQRFFGRQLGQTVPVLFETRLPDGSYVGYTPQYIRVTAPSGTDLRGRVCPVRLLAVSGETVEGILCEQE